MKHHELIEYFDSLPAGERYEVPVSERFPISPLSHGDILTVQPDCDIIAGSTYLVAIRGSLFVMRATLYDNVLFLTDLTGKTATFTDDDAEDVAVLARVIDVSFR